MQHLQPAEFLDVGGRRFIQLQLALFHQLHGGDGGDGLGHGRDHENGIGIDGDAGRGVALAEGSRIGGLARQWPPWRRRRDIVLLRVTPARVWSIPAPVAPQTAARLRAQNEQALR